MKKKLAVLISFFFITVISAQSQSIKLRHMEGFKSIKVGGAINPGSATTAVLLGYNHYINKDMFAGLDINYEWGEIDQSDVKNINLDLYFNYSFVSFNNTLFLNAVAGFSGGMENYKSIVLNNTEIKNNFVGGVLYGLSAEFFLNNTLCLEPFYTQHWQTGSEMGSFYYRAGISLKYNF